MVKFNSKSDDDHFYKHRLFIFNCFFCERSSCKQCEPGFKEYNIKAPSGRNVMRCVLCLRRKPRAYSCNHEDETCKNCVHPFDRELQTLVNILRFDRRGPFIWEDDVDD